MTNRIRWGVLGNATIARKCVIPAIQKSRNGRMHALATRSPGGAREVVSENKIPRVYDNYDAVLTDPQIDAVYIPLPNHLHHPWTMKALSAGKHVLCEKPLACNAGEAREMLAGAAESDRLLMEAFMYRFHPRSRRIKKIVDRGDIGNACLVRTAFCFHMDENILQSGGNARLKKDKGGGALMDVGCYGVSVARWLMGSEPITVQAQAVYHPDGVDVHFAGTLRFAEGRLAVIEASFVSALQQTYSVVGSRGALELPNDAFVPWEKDARYIQRRADEETGRQHLIPGADEYQLMVEHFADAVNGQAQLLYPAEDSIANMRVLDALAEAARTGNTVTV
ncbi:MAG: Gfo/Idh/MocA family oxidoreductase [Deltaproteobacteria bacterium]|nr:Gfo/Idh/MocA family oxidoreductase [Deltaproteobacteria bacterium]